MVMRRNEHWKAFSHIKSEIEKESSRTGFPNLCGHIPTWKSFMIRLTRVKIDFKKRYWKNEQYIAYKKSSKWSLINNVTVLGEGFNDFVRFKYKSVMMGKVEFGWNQLP